MNKNRSLQPVPLLCYACMARGTVRVAWTVGVGDAMCVRCAIETHTDDDMNQHDLVVQLYEALRTSGYPDVY
jgi:hypothetical protein